MNHSPRAVRLLYYGFMILSLSIALVACVRLPLQSESVIEIESTGTRTPFLPQLPSITLTMTVPSTSMPLDPTSSVTQKPIPTSTDLPLTVNLTVIYDNIPYDPRLQTDWGFACLIESGETTVLFDTGGNGNILMNNMAILGIDAGKIDAIAISHLHGDHTGGLASVANDNPDAKIYLPVAFSEGFKSVYRQQNRLVEVTDWLEIVPGIYLTGQIGSGIVEQALVVETEKGLVVVTGCAHPGIVEIVKRVDDYGDVYLVMGGFHLNDLGAGQIQVIIDALRDSGVQKVAPSHCSGTLAIDLFQKGYGQDFIPSGAGATIQP